MYIKKGGQNPLFIFKFYDFFVIQIPDNCITKTEAMRKIGEAGIPAGAVLDTGELNDEKDFENRGIMQVMDHPIHEPFKMPGWPVLVDGKASNLKPSPVLGEHTDQILKEWLGLDEDDIISFKAQGVLNV